MGDAAFSLEGSKRWGRPMETGQKKKGEVG
jgi:hypothetical protein